MGCGDKRLDSGVGLSLSSLLGIERFYLEAGEGMGKSDTVPFPSLSSSAAAMVDYIIDVAPTRPWNQHPWRAGESRWSWAMRC